MTRHLRHALAHRGRRMLLLLLGASLVAWFPLTAGSVYSSPVKLDVPYVPTPHQVVAKMLEMANVGPSDFLIDLGSGDGRIAIAAVRDHDARGAFGVDLNPERIAEARANAQAEGVADRVTFKQADLFDTDLSGATVISMYLLPSVNLKLRPRLLDMPPGTRIVSHAFDMEDWVPDQFEQVGNLDIFFWTVPAQVNGKWMIGGPDGDFQIDVTQQFQILSGEALLPGQAPGTVKGIMRGEIMQFDVDDGRTTRRYVGRVAGDSIVAVREAGAQQDWSARRP